MRIIAATNNHDKLKEFRQILSPFGYEVMSLKEAGIAADVEESGSTFLENAIIKAKTIMALSGQIALADDSGLEVLALDGEPGVYSARYAHGSDEDRMNKLLQRMYGIDDRRARFVCEVALCFTDGQIVSCRGECEGKITDQPKGVNGFGYDPIFYIDQFKGTFAELVAEEKNKISHRGVALQKLREKLSQQDK